MKVSVCIITYNHEKFIDEAIRSVLMQKTNFDIELVIGDDYSTDNTRSIILDYKKKYHNIIKLMFASTNLGMNTNFINTLKSCSGKYVALCEGDDYWIDPLKLQKQVDFLELNPSYSICYHRVNELYPNQKIKVETLNTSLLEKTLTIADLAKGNFIHTPSVIFRNKLFENYPEWFCDCPVGDYPLQMLNAKFGYIKYLPETMAVYRHHTSSNWASKSMAFKYKRWLSVLEFLIREKFEIEIIEKLKGQRKLIACNYIKLLIMENDYSYIEELSLIAADDEEFKNEWLTNHYPTIIKEIRSSKIYKLSHFFSSIKERCLGKRVK